MLALDILFQNKLQNIVFFERKIQIIDKFTILIGAKLSGKSYLIYDYIKNNEYEEYLYIDMLNLKNLEFKENNLQEFINKNKIKILVIENYNYDFTLPEVDSIIISTNNYKKIDNFSLLKVMPLDFEEFIAFDTKHQNTTNSFNAFLKYGNIAQLIDYKDINKEIRNQEILKLSYQNETKYKILELFIKNSSSAKSTFLLYTLLKKEIKISKDFFYKTTQEFEQNLTILLCPKYNSPKSVKKIFIYNHAFMHSVTYNKNFTAVFSNMIFLELYSKYDNVYYSDNIDFYIKQTQTIILAIPFYNSSILSVLSANILKTIENLSCKNISIVTISNQDNIYLNNIPCEILPFYEWAMIA